MNRPHRLLALLLCAAMLSASLPFLASAQPAVPIVGRWIRTGNKDTVEAEVSAYPDGSIALRFCDIKTGLPDIDIYGWATRVNEWITIVPIPSLSKDVVPFSFRGSAESGSFFALDLPDGRSTWLDPHWEALPASPAWQAGITNPMGVVVQPPIPYQPQPQQSGNVGYTPAVLNQRMATRSGPGTKYTEDLGTLPMDTQITLIQAVTTNGTPWGEVEFSRNGMLYRAYTGMKRINAQGVFAQGDNSYYEVTLSQSVSAYYGPGYNYALRKGAPAPGMLLRVFRVENGFYQVDYQGSDRWVRAWLPAI